MASIKEFLRLFKDKSKNISSPTHAYVLYVSIWVDLVGNSWILVQIYSSQTIPHRRIGPRVEHDGVLVLGLDAALREDAVALAGHVPEPDAVAAAVALDAPVDQRDADAAAHVLKLFADIY